MAKLLVKSVGANVHAEDDEYWAPPAAWAEHQLRRT